MDTKVKIESTLEKHLLEELEKAKPSSDPAYWAKPGCKDCGGRGVIGKQTVTLKGNNIITNDLLCMCGRKRWNRWKEEWLDNRRAQLRAERDADSGTNGSNGNGKSKEMSQHTQDRLSRIRDQMTLLQTEINRCDVRVTELPHLEKLAEFDQKLEVAREEVEDAEEAIAEVERQAAWALSESERLAKEAKKFARESVRLEQEAKSRRGKEIPELIQQVQGLEVEREVVDRAMQKAIHQIRRKQRVAEQKLEKMTARQQKIITESGVETLPDSVGLDGVV